MSKTLDIFLRFCSKAYFHGPLPFDYLLIAKILKRFLFFHTSKFLHVISLVLFQIARFLEFLPFIFLSKGNVLRPFSVCFFFKNEIAWIIWRLFFFQVEASWIWLSSFLFQRAKCLNHVSSVFFSGSFYFRSYYDGVHTLPQFFHKILLKPVKNSVNNGLSLNLPALKGIYPTSFCQLWT